MDRFESKSLLISVLSNEASFGLVNYLISILLPKCQDSRESMNFAIQETDSTMVGELHQEAQDVVGDTARNSDRESDQLPGQNARGSAASLLRTAPKVVCKHARDRRSQT